MARSRTLLDLHSGAVPSCRAEVGRAVPALLPVPGPFHAGGRPSQDRASKILVWVGGIVKALLSDYRFLVFEQVLKQRLRRDLPRGFILVILL